MIRAQCQQGQNIDAAPCRAVLFFVLSSNNLSCNSYRTLHAQRSGDGSSVSSAEAEGLASGVRIRPRLRVRLARAERARRADHLQRDVPPILDRHLPQDMGEASGYTYLISSLFSG